MIVLEFKAYGKLEQFTAVDEALRTVQFIRNKCLRFWIDGLGKSQYDLNKYCAVLAHEFPFADRLNSMARQASAERAWSAIARFYDNCKKRLAPVGFPDAKSETRQKVPGLKGFPKFQKDNRSIEYKTSGWKLSDDRKSITFTDKNGIGRLKMKARVKLARVHLKISRQRKDHAVKLARCVAASNDVIVYEDLRIKNMVKNHCLAKSINDAGWYQFRVWLEYFGKVFKRVTIAVNPAYTSQECSSCSVIVKKSLSTRTHVCQCGCVLDRDHNAGINILNSGLGTIGHIGTSALDVGNASGDIPSTLAGANLREQGAS